VATSTPWPEVVNPGPNNLHVLLVLPQEIGPNWYLSEDNFELFGWDLTLTGEKTEIAPCASVEAWYGLNKTSVDVMLDEIADLDGYDALAIMPASKKNSAPYGDLLDSPEMLAHIQDAYTGGKVVYATCGGVRVLAAADILEGKSVAGEESFEGEYLAAGATYIPGRVMPVIEGNLVTTVNGLYFQVEDSEAVAVALENTMPEQEKVPGDVDTLTYEVDVRNTSWTRTFGGASADGGRAIQQTSDGGYILAGYTYSFGAGYADLYLIKTDKDGNLEWSNAYGGAGWEYGFSVVEMEDGGYLSVGYTTSNGMGGRDVYLVKTDGVGNLLWSKTYGGAGLDVGKGVDIAPDGGYILVGYTESFGAGQNDVYVVKTDPDGNEEWARTFGGDQSELGMAVKALANGGYVFTGTTGSFDVDNRDAYLVRTDAEGKEIWSKTYGNVEGFLAYEIGNDVQLSPDNGYVLAGNHNTGQSSSGGELLNIYLLKTDENGNEVWTSSAGRGPFYDYGSALMVMPDGGYTVVGTTKSGSDNNDLYLVRFDESGNILWQKSFGNFASEWGSGLALSSDGGMVMVGHTNSFGAGSFDMWLLKVNIE
jgi:hypothetical protein